MTINRKILITISLITIFSLINLFWLLNQNKSDIKQNTTKVGDLKSLMNAVNYLKTKEPLGTQNILQELSPNEATSESNLNKEILESSGSPKIKSP